MPDDIYKIYITLGINNGPDDGYNVIDENTILVNRHSDTPLIFSYRSMDDWSILTAANYIKNMKGEQNEFGSN